MTAFEYYEIKAEAFHNMTGFMAPGKDGGKIISSSYIERQNAWEVWNLEYAQCVNAMFNAFAKIMETPNEQKAAHQIPTNRP